VAPVKLCAVEVAMVDQNIIRFRSRKIGLRKVSATEIDGFAT
jgi:hypothetical protein